MSENTGLTFVRCMVFPLIAPVWGEYYRIGACPYLLGITIFCPCAIFCRPYVTHQLRKFTGHQYLKIKMATANAPLDYDSRLRNY